MFFQTIRVMTVFSHLKSRSLRGEGASEGRGGKEKGRGESEGKGRREKGRGRGKMKKNIRNGRREA